GHVVDIAAQRTQARRIGAEVVYAVTGSRAHIDARAVLGGAHPHHDVIAKTHERRARHRFDPPLAPAGLRWSHIDDAPLTFRNHGERPVIGFERRHPNDQLLRVRLTGAL